jgi:hypothetical protein
MKLCRALTLGLLALATTAMEARAQRAIPSVVQLPSFQTFSYSGTVVVPDSGGAYLGGVRRSSSGSSRRGLSRGFGFAQGNSQLSVHPTIIDNNEIDRQLLGGTPKQFVEAGRAKAQQDKSKVAKPIDPNEEGKALVRFARKQYREGNKTASFDTYRMAIGVLDGRLSELAKVEFRRVFGAAADQSLRMASLRR